MYLITKNAQSVASNLRKAKFTRSESERKSIDHSLSLDQPAKTHEKDYLATLGKQVGDR